MTEAKNTSGIHPKGNKVLLKPIEVDRVSKGGILIPTTIADREDMAQMFAYVVELGAICWPDEPAARCAVGDYVIFAKYAGQPFKGDDGVTYRLVNGKDIIATKDYNPEDVVLNSPTRKDIDPEVKLDETEMEHSHV